MRTKNVAEWLEASAERFPDKIAFSDGNTSMTFSELRDAARRIGTELMHRGLIGQPILIVMENTPEAIATFFGCAYSRNYYNAIV